MKEKATLTAELIDRIISGLPNGRRIKSILLSQANVNYLFKTQRIYYSAVFSTYAFSGFPVYADARVMDDELAFERDDGVAAIVDNIHFMNEMPVEKPPNLCRCGVWATGGLHSDWCHESLAGTHQHLN